MAQFIGSQQVTVTQKYDIVIDSAGGPFQVPGDYLYQAFNQEQKMGIWGLFRVTARQTSSSGQIARAGENWLLEAVAGERAGCGVAIRRQSRLLAWFEPRLAQAIGVAMRKSVACLFAVGLPALALLAFFIQARSRDSLRRGSPSNALRPVTDAEAAVKSGVNAGPEISLGRFKQEGISIECSLTRIGGAERTGDAFFEGDDVRFRFRIADGSGTPLTSVFPAAWLLARPAGSVTTPQMAVKKAQSMVNASILSPADLDLNVYYVLTLNGNGTIGVVDPLFGYGGTKLLAMVPLKSPGADWVLSKDETTVYVSLPKSNEVAVVDTATWEVRKYVPGGLIPERIALQPDGQYLWVGGGGVGERFADSGVTVLNTATLDVAARIRTGMGHHDIAFSDDSRFAFVTNSQQDTVSVIDVRTLKKRGDVQTGKTPASIDFSTTAQVAYVTHAGDGTIAVVSGEEARVIRRLQAETGLGQIRFSPRGRLGFVVNPEKDLVHILDAARAAGSCNQVPLKAGPTRLRFRIRWRTCGIGAARMC